MPILSRDEIGDTCQSFEQMRLQLRAARDTREKFDQNRKELLAGISHDLSTPLTKIEATPAVLSTALPIRQKSSAIMWP